MSLMDSRPKFPSVLVGDKDISAIRDAQRRFQCPHGYQIYMISESDIDRSPMYRWGIRVAEVAPTGSSTKNATIPGYFYCMANSKCRDKGVRMKINNKNTSPATAHLREIHNVISRRGEDTAKKYRRSSRTSDLQEDMSNKLFRDDPVRFLALEFVKTHTIKRSVPINLYDDEDTKRLLLMVGAENDHMPAVVRDMSSKAVKGFIDEIYVETKTGVATQLAMQKKGFAGPWAHISVDLWTSRTSRDRFIGLRIFYLTDDFCMKTHLLAVKVFRPGKDTSDQRSGEVIRTWAGQALHEFGLEWSDVLGAVTDSGSDVRFAFNEMDGVFSEWCIPHLLYRAISETFEVSGTPSSSKTPAARDVINNLKKDMEHINKSDPSKIGFEELLEEKYGRVPKGKLTQPAPHRWVSGSQCLERYLVYFADLVAFFAKEGKKLAVTDRQELLEIYSLMKSLALVIESCQGTSSPAAPGAIQRVFGLLSAMRADKPLSLHSPSDFFKPPARQGEDENDVSVGARQVKPHAELSPVAQDTRVELRSAIFARFGKKRWGNRYREESHLFDMVNALNPTARKLGYIDHFAPNAAVATAVKAKVWSQLEGLTQRVVDAERAQGATKNGHNSPGREPHSNPPSKRLKCTSTPGLAGADDCADLGFFDSYSEADLTEQDPALRSSAEVARELVGAYKTAQIPKEFGASMRDGNAISVFWRGYGKEHFPTVSKAARAVLGAPASSAVFERDLGEAAEVLNLQRNSLSPARIEMLMFLRGTYDSIPMDIPALSSQAADNAIPYRLADPRQRAAVSDMEAGFAEDMLADGGDIISGGAVCANGSSSHPPGDDDVMCL